MTPFQKRLQWLVDHKADGNMSKLAKMAGLKGRTHVSAMIREDDPRDVALSTIEKLARAAGVSPAWLAFGYGTAEDTAGALPDELVDAIRIGRRWSTWTVEAVARVAKATGATMTIGGWSDELDRWEDVHTPLASSLKQKGGRTLAQPASAPRLKP